MQEDLIHLHNDLSKLEFKDAEVGVVFIKRVKGKTKYVAIKMEDWDFAYNKTYYLGKTSRAWWDILERAREALETQRRYISRRQLGVLLEDPLFISFADPQGKALHSGFVGTKGETEYWVR